MKFKPRYDSAGGAIVCGLVLTAILFQIVRLLVKR